MSDVFISYARSTSRQAQAIAEALRALGCAVWLDDALPAHRAYTDVIEERLRAAKAVVVIWSAEAAKSHWVRAEANAALEAGTLIQLSLDGAVPPMPFNQIQCADMNGWAGEADQPGWRKVLASVAELTGGRPETEPHRPAPAPRKLSICVLPFANMSGDPEQEYFSDGISEDIITDLSKVSALSVVARNTAFGFKGKSPNIKDAARQLGVSHVLEGSVRKAGNRVRISARLVDGAAGDHIWAERYDRDLTDIFALQDEISEAIVKALKLRLLPAEKKAIERRGTDSVEAYDLYLMARQRNFTGNSGDARLVETVLRLSQRATEIDPGYAQAWALLGWAQANLRFRFGRRDLDGSAAIDKALALDPDLAEAHASKAANLQRMGRYDEASQEVEAALRLDPESFETNTIAAFLCLSQRQFADAVPRLEKAAALVETGSRSPMMLITCYTALGDPAGARRAAGLTLARVEAALAQDPRNGNAIGHGVIALASLGEAARTRDCICRGLRVDPDNQTMRYDFARAIARHLEDFDGAIDLLGPYLAHATRTDLIWAGTDPYLDVLRDDPRFQAMLAAAEARLVKEKPADAVESA